MAESYYVERLEAALAENERLKAEMQQMKPARQDDIPKATHEGTQTLFGVEVRTYRLDDGRSVIHADDFHKLLKAMGLTATD